jgi:hypothetical protein
VILTKTCCKGIGIDTTGVDFHAVAGKALLKAVRGPGIEWDVPDVVCQWQAEGVNYGADAGGKKE